MDKMTLEVLKRVTDAVGELHSALGLCEALAFGVYMGEQFKETEQEKPYAEAEAIEIKTNKGEQKCKKKTK